MAPGVSQLRLGRWVSKEPLAQLARAPEVLCCRPNFFGGIEWNWHSKSSSHFQSSVLRFTWPISSPRFTSFESTSDTDNMASNNSVAALARMSHSTFRQACRPASLLRVSRAFSSSQRLGSAPPLLAQIKTDLKTAMRAKDVPRLSVLRSVLSASNEAAKQDKEIKTDAQVVTLLKKTATGINQAIEEAKKANRQDLVDKEEAQIKIVDEYVAQANVDILSEEEVKTALQGRLAELRTLLQDEKAVINTLRSETKKLSWAPAGKHVEIGVAMQILNDLLKQ